MRKIVIEKIGLIACALLFVSLASAQVPTSGNVFFGYSFENAGSSAFDLSNVSRPNMNGWEASLEGKVLPHVGLVADFGGHYGSQSFVEATPDGPVTGNVTGHEEEVLFGPRIAVSVGKFRPFGEFMVGVAHMSTSDSGPSDTSFATALGGGLDYKIIRPVAWRFQGDYVQTRFFGTTQSDVRISTGIVLRF
jgi:hypothetical protein